MGKSAGPPPDYQGAAQQQAKSGQQNLQQQTFANRPNQSTPWASSGWTQGPNGQWTQSTGFNGPLAGAAQGLQGQIAQNFGQPLDNGSAARDQAINAMYGQATSRLNPQWDQRQERMGAQLANQGLDPNSQAYRQAQNQFSQQRNDAYGSAMNSAIGMGNEAQNLTFNQNLASRNMPLQELQGLGGFLAMPGFSQAGMADPTQYLSAAGLLGNYNLGNAQQQNQSVGGLLGGIGSAAGTLGGAAILASDERLKRDIVRLDVEALPGVPVATWEYAWMPGVRHRGVIAQDLEKVAPQFVRVGADGLRRVDYSFAPGLFGEVKNG